MIYSYYYLKINSWSKNYAYFIMTKGIPLEFTIFEQLSHDSHNLFSSKEIIL